MTRLALSLLIVCVLAYAGLCAMLFVSQRSLMYFPQPGSGGVRAATLTLHVDEAEVLVTTRPRDGSDAVIYFGGNAEDVSYSLPGLAATFPDHGLFLMHYRGYGGSTGAPSEAALFADALALFDRVHATHREIVVIGRSLGSGVATYLASRRPVARLVLVTPFDSMLELASELFPWAPVRWLMRDRYESGRYAETITAPTLLFAAGRDEFIPLASTEALLGHFPPGVATLKVIAATGHNTISESPEYLPLLGGSQ